MLTCEVSIVISLSMRTRGYAGGSLPSSKSNDGDHEN